MVIRSACLPKLKSLLLDLYYADTELTLKMSLRGAWQCEAALALRPSGKFLSTEVWIRLRLRLEGGGVSLGLGLGLGLALGWRGREWTQL